MYQIKNLIYGTISGLIGGIIYAILLINVDALKNIGEVFKIATPSAQLVVHLLISAFIGLTFAFFFQKLVRGLVSGLISGIIYGLVWWFIGPLTLIPYFKGLPYDSLWHAGKVTGELFPAGAHILFGVFLGITYAFFKVYPLIKQGKSTPTTA